MATILNKALTPALFDPRVDTSVQRRLRFNSSEIQPRMHLTLRLGA